MAVLLESMDGLPALWRAFSAFERAACLALKPSRSSLVPLRADGFSTKMNDARFNKLQTGWVQKGGDPTPPLSHTKV